MESHDHTSTPERGAHAHRKFDRDMSHIQGWGADLDHKNRPAYPMERTPPRLEGVHWDVPEQQPVNIEVFHSTERPDITPVFGTSAPPKGLSGWIRRAAFKWSENDLRHWLMLLFADRVNVVEGLGEDLMEGRIPNPLAEMGIKAEMRHNPEGLAMKAVMAGAVLGIGYYLLTRRKDDDGPSVTGGRYDPSILSYDPHSYSSEHPGVPRRSDRPRKSRR